MSINLMFAWFQFSFFDNRCIFRYKSMKSVKIKINRWTKRVCHRFLPIDRYNRYQSNQIYRFLTVLTIYRLINRYRFLSIDYSGVFCMGKSRSPTNLRRLWRRRSVQMSGAPNGNFREDICSEDDLRSRIFGAFVVKFLSCLPLLGFSNIYKMV